LAKKRKTGRSSDRGTPPPAANAAPAPSRQSLDPVPRSRRGLWLGVALAAVVLAAITWQLSRPVKPTTSAPAAAAPAPPPASPTVVGSAACAGCHAAEHAAWQGSQHARAMQHATADTVRGDFDDAKFAYAGVESTFFKRDGKFFVRTDGPDGKLADFEIKYTFGVEPLQQYLVELPGGRLQALSITWDTRPKGQGGQRWFHQYPKEKIDFRDELHWTRRAQNWNFMCADCHSTQIVKGYDAGRDAFATRWSELSVGCESCHGPGSAHVGWAKDKPADPRKGLTVALDERRGVTWAIDSGTGIAARSVARSTEREIEVCAQCHSRRAQIAEDYQPGKPFLDHYLPALLTPDLYHADGQQREEVFIWGSWLQSRMHRKGVTCSDCHDPHTQKLRAEGNAVCGQCHAPGRFDAPAHHHHAAGSAGAQCAGCHMPATTYMVIDPRRDHGMRVPRPDLSVAIGTPNACNVCHRDKEAKWAAAAVRGWLGREPGGFQTYAAAFHAGEAGSAGARAALVAIADDANAAPIARASALVRSTAGGAADAAAVARAAADAQPLLRLAAAQAAATLPAAERPGAVGVLLNDRFRAVRIEAARVLAGVQRQMPAQQGEAWAKAADEFVATQKYNADRPEARAALGQFYADQGRFDAAAGEFAGALSLDVGYVPAYVNAADALRVQGRDAEAARMLEQGIAHAPRNAELHYALGLALVRLRAPERALGELEGAMRLAPDNARYAYVHAVALNSLGRRAEALRALERALGRWPADRDMLVALAAVQRDAGQQAQARSTVRRLLAAHPEDPDAQALARELGVAAKGR
jgi:predicted CXXCH cytochrome family protein